ncbi:TIGR01212 family radical SAM protein [Flammeovirgaceae bacterium SG7u.111]|nr:TIGR01212 family radical SAM protein [Flammeovirgaceae bacterium SG7u.132]WPO34870.1 TIGR01212 family radical SAM protein [Flammeovirgaceae bacterium SG7u.111]
MEFPWQHERRFNAYSNYLKRVFGGRIQKVSIDAGFTCPNRDGSKGNGGCTFCFNDSFTPSYCSESDGISDQIEKGIEFHKKRYRKSTNFLAYFQAFSNTYKPLEELKEIYSEALAQPEIMGLVIGTRPDCIDNEKLDYLAKLAEKHYITVEYGIESVYDKTLRRINRGHTFAESEKAIRATSQRGIRTGGHLIFGLPGESQKDMLESAKIISELPLHSIKFHQLQIIKGTRMGANYKRNTSDFELFDLPDYLDFIKSYLEQLPPSLVIERIAGESSPELNLGRNWGMRYHQVLTLFERLLEKENTWQGRLHKEVKHPSGNNFSTFHK